MDQKYNLTLEGLEALKKRLEELKVEEKEDTICGRWSRNCTCISSGKMVT